MAGRRGGLTLVEVILATAILAVCVLGLMHGFTASFEIFRASAFIHEAANVLSRGEAAHPLHVETDPEEDLAVSADSGIMDGWTFERTVEEDADEDGLFVVRTRVYKGRGGPGMEQAYVRLIYHGK